MGRRLLQDYIEGQTPPRYSQHLSHTSRPLTTPQTAHSHTPSPWKQTDNIANYSQPSHPKSIVVGTAQCGSTNSGPTVDASLENETASNFDGRPSTCKNALSNLA